MHLQFKVLFQIFSKTFSTFIRNRTETRMRHSSFPKYMEIPVECLISENYKTFHNVNSFITQNIMLH